MIAVGLAVVGTALLVGGATVFGKPAPAPAAKAALAVPQAIPAPKPVPKPAAASSQHLRIAIGSSGYEPSQLTASTGSPITLTVGKGDGCAAGFLMPELGIDADNSQGAVTLKLGKLKAGTYRFGCAMEMVGGQLIVR